MPHLVFHRHEALLYLVEHTDEHIVTVGSSTDVFRDDLYNAMLFPHVTHVQTAKMTVNQMYDLVTNVKPDVVFYEPDAVEKELHDAIYRAAPHGRLYQLDDNSPRDAEMALLERFETEYRDVLAAWVTSESGRGTPRSILDARRDVLRDRVTSYSGRHTFDPQVRIAKHIEGILRAEHQARLVNQYHTLMENLNGLRTALPYVTLPGDMLTALHQWARRQDGE